MTSTFQLKRSTGKFTAKSSNTDTFYIHLLHIIFIQIIYASNVLAKFDLIIKYVSIHVHDIVLWNIITHIVKLLSDILQRFGNSTIGWDFLQNNSSVDFSIWWIVLQMHLFYESKWGSSSLTLSYNFERVAAINYHWKYFECF